MCVPFPNHKQPMNKLIITLLSLVSILGVEAQDFDSWRYAGNYYVPEIAHTGDNGVKYWIKSYAPFCVGVGNSNRVYYEGEDLCDCLFPEPDNGFTTVGTGEYSGDIVIPEQVKIGDVYFTVTRIGYGAFGNCKNLTSVKLPSTLDDIRRGAFYGCTSLTEVITSPYDPDSDTYPTIHPNVFEGCTNLRYVDLSNIRYIPDGIFQYCHNLTTVRMGADYCQLYAFRNRSTPSLRKIICTTDYAEEWGSHAEGVFFDSEFATAELIVPYGAIDFYRRNSVWGKFQNIREGDEASLDSPYMADWQIVSTGPLTGKVIGDFGSLTIYRPDGMRINTVNPENPIFEVPQSGIYIVIDNNAAARKIIF